MIDVQRNQTRSRISLFPTANATLLIVNFTQITTDVAGWNIK